MLENRMSEKREFAGWWFFFLTLVVLTIPVLWGLNSAGMLLGKKVERAVLVNSHQYIEGMAQRAATLKANIVEAEAQLSIAQDAETRSNINAQLAALRVQLGAISRIKE